MIKSSYIIFLSTFLFAQACSTKNKIENKEPYLVSIDTILNVVDTALLFHVDTLYYKDKKFTGTIFKLYSKLDTAFIGNYLKFIKLLILINHQISFLNQILVFSTINYKSLDLRQVY